MNKKKLCLYSASLEKQLKLSREETNKIVTAYEAMEAKEALGTLHNREYIKQNKQLQVVLSKISKLIKELAKELFIDIQEGAIAVESNRQLQAQNEKLLKAIKRIKKALSKKETTMSDKKWLSDLLKYVHTTKEQALIIRQRNKEMLQKIQNWSLTDDYARVSISCPHCDEVGGICINCSFYPMYYISEVRSISSVACLRTEFDGLITEDLYGYYWNLTLGCNSMRVERRVGADTKEEKAQEKEEKKGIILYLEAHIEWANTILKGDSDEHLQSS